MATPNNRTYEDRKGNVFNTREEALNSNQSGTNTTERTNFNPSSSIPPTINTSNLTTPSSLVLPNTPVSSFGNIQPNINTSLTQGISARQKQLDAEAEQAKQTRDKGLEDILNVTELLGQSGKMQEKAFKQEGVDTLRTQYDDFTNQLEQEQQTLTRKLQELDKNTQGFFGGGLAQEKERVQRESLAKQADLAILQNSALRKYDTARSIAERKVELQLEPLKARLDSMKFIYGENKDLFNTTEKRAYENLIKDEERAYKTEEENKNNINNIMLEAAKNGASSSIVSKISNAKTPAEALVLGASYMTNPIEQAIKSKQLKKLEQEIASNNVTLTNPTVAGSTQNLAQKMLNSANQKGDLSQTEREKLAKMALVVQQLDTLQSSIKKSNSTGLFRGRVNTLLANLGANADAGNINAQIQALIPNVARGIYGEVGVLTDADIENYRRTLPNIKTIEQQNDLVLAMTLRNAALSYENALKSAVNSNINVSGWTEDYMNIKKQVADIEDRSGISKTKVGKAYENQSLQPMIDDLVRAGATDREILQVLGME